MPNNKWLNKWANTFQMKYKPLATSEMQIQIPLRFHLTQLEWLKLTQKNENQTIKKNDKYWLIQHVEKRNFYMLLEM